MRSSIWLVAAMCSCATPAVTSPYAMECVKLAQPHASLFRCENVEAICYIYGESPNCVWKELPE